MQALVFLESFSTVHSTVSYPCAQRSRISLTPIRTIHNAHFQVNVCTSGRQRVDCSAELVYSYCVSREGSLHPDDFTRQYQSTSTCDSRSRSTQDSTSRCELSSRKAPIRISMEGNVHYQLILTYDLSLDS